MLWDVSVLLKYHIWHKYGLQSLSSISVTTIQPEDQNKRACGRACDGFLRVCMNMVDFSLLKNPVFALYGISCFLCMSGR